MTRLRLSHAALVAGLFAVTSVTAATLEERMAQLEQKVTSLEQENTALKKQLSYDAKGKPTAATVTAQGKESKLALGGFLHFQAETGDAADSRFPAADRFLMRKMRLGAKGSFGDKFDFSLTADLGANSLGATTGYRVQATDVFGVWKANPAANFTFGQFKSPYGYEYLIGDVKTVSVERSLASDVLTLGRQTGAMLGGSFFEKRLTYAVAMLNGNGANNSFNDNEEFTYVGRLAGTVFDNKQVKVTVGANAFTSEDTGTSFTGRRTGQGADIQVALGGATLSAEVLQTQFDRVTGNDYDASGWYVQGTYFLVPDKWQLVARYENYEPSDIVNADETNLTTIGFNYFIKGDDLKLLVNYLIGNPAGSSQHQDRLIARFQVVF